MAGAIELDSLNSVKYLYLSKLTEPRDNSLRIVVREAISNPPFTNLGESSRNVVQVSRIESTENCRTFELTWQRYVAYLVTEEVVGSCGRYEDEIYSGKQFRVYNRSHFLEHLSRDTGLHTEPILHYKLICLNHLIDVAAYAAPEFKQIDQNPLKKA